MNLIIQGTSACIVIPTTADASRINIFCMRCENVNAKKLWIFVAQMVPFFHSNLLTGHMFRPVFCPRRILPASGANYCAPSLAAAAAGSAAATSASKIAFLTAVKSSPYPLLSGFNWQARVNDAKALLAWSFLN